LIKSSSSRFWDCSKVATWFSYWEWTFSRLFIYDIFLSIYSSMFLAVAIIFDMAFLV
jgi:hypothetical protein